ncbi:MAG TPA: FUSC family protein, partial [Ramlibacter sp.]|uniref:FUSC family protein n=1 Tax=Ramlibacter sp. TaxID=1917967 RepID=UPI002D7F77EA
IADALRWKRRSQPHARPRPALDAAAGVPQLGAAWESPAPRLLARSLARRLVHVHHEIAQLLQLARGERAPDAEVMGSAWREFVTPTHWSWQPLHSLWRLDAPPLRHGIRAALAIAAGYMVARAIPWTVHETWILLTIAFVLRTSFSQTVERRNSRIVGTLLGCVLAGALLHARLPAFALLLVVALAHGLAHAFVLQRYLVTAVAASVLALLQAHLLNAASVPAFDVAERVIDTMIGVGIASIFSYVLPSWERMQIGSLVARALAAQARHAQLALRLGHVNGVSTESEVAWRLARREAYDSLSALALAVQRSRSEPRGVQPPLGDVQRMLERSYQLLAQLTAVKTMLLRRRALVDLRQMQAPLKQAAASIAAVLSSRGGQALPARADAIAPPPEQQTGLSPWVLRRLHLATQVASELRADAARVTGRGH